MSATVKMHPPLEHKLLKAHGTPLITGSTGVPKEFFWPNVDLVRADDVLQEPLVDLEGFFRRDPAAIQRAAKLVRAACLSHGVFQVVNHGVDSRLISMAHEHINAFFKLPISMKLRAQKLPGDLWGFSSAHSERFSSKLPWKETLSFGFHENEANVVVDFFNSSLGKEFEQTGLVYQKYCESMKKLSLVLMEILGLSLGLEQCKYYKEFFEDDGSSIMRCNYYPPCQEPGVALGTGPHCDPTSLTILHQDQVGGLEVLVDNKWRSVRPRRDAFVINIGDTFTALTNGRYKSCMHRAVVNSWKERMSLAYFVCPKGDKILRPPRDLVSSEVPRKYPDFTWSDLLRFTQTHHRADGNTLHHFTLWLASLPNDISRLSSKLSQL